ncbi:hypothetical protein GmHk_16G046411 [Glycine max]|nr:hypothetical protein GmHk_16G046411 [Glycine max]
MGAKYLKVVKQESHPNNGWSPDEIRGSKDKTLILFERNNIWPVNLPVSGTCKNLKMISTDTSSGYCQIRSSWLTQGAE